MMIDRRFGIPAEHDDAAFDRRFGIPAEHHDAAFNRRFGIPAEHHDAELLPNAIVRQECRTS